MTTPEHGSRQPVHIEIPLSVPTLNKDKSRRLLNSFTGEVKNHLFGELPGPYDHLLLAMQLLGCKQMDM